MSNEVYITIFGRLTDDPELRFTASGAPVVNVSVAHNSRRFNKSTNEWEDSTTSFYRGSQWGTGAENVAETLRKGMPVIVYGVLGDRTWDKDGQTQRVKEIKIEHIGLDLQFVKVDASHVEKSAPKSGQSTPPPQASTPPAQVVGGSDNDPWATTPMSADPPF